CGSAADRLRRHEQDAQRALSRGIRGARELALQLPPRIADAGTMRLAWDYLARRGGQAPGRNGHRYGDYASAEVWDLCRALATAVRDGTYRPGPERIKRIEKASGTGTRPIVLLNIED